MSGVIRDCNSTIPLSADELARITHRCVRGIFNILYQGFGLQVDGTVCPCFTPLCNAGNITFEETEGSGPPTTTARASDLVTSVGSSEQSTSGTTKPRDIQATVAVVVIAVATYINYLFDSHLVMQ